MRKQSVLLIVGLWVHIPVDASLGEPTDLLVYVRAHKSTLVLGEPLFITARVRNEGTKHVNMFRQNSPSYELRSHNPFLLMTSADGNKYENWSDSLRTRRKTSPIELVRGAELSTGFVILFSGRHGFAFKKPAEYWITVKVIDTDMASFQAEPIKVTVTPPGRESLDAWRVLGGKKFGKKYGELIQTPWRARLNAEDLGSFDDMIKRYPRSIYTEYLALCMGRWYLEGRNRDKSQAPRYLEIAKSMASSDFLKAKAMKALERK